MRKPKKKIGYIIGCVALSILLGVSSYIGLVIVGVVAEEKKNNNSQIQQNNNVFSDNVNTQNAIVENGQIVNGGYVVDGSGNGNVNVIDSGNVVGSSNVFDAGNVGDGNISIPQENDIVDVPVTDNASDNDNSASNNSQNAQNSVSSDKPSSTNSLLDKNKTAADIVSIYATVMNKAKADKPGFTKIEYQELPGDPANRVISEGDEHVSEESVNKLLGFVEDLGVFVPKEKAESEPYIHEKGDEDMSLFPVFSRAKGSYLTDPKGIESFTYEILSNGNVKFSFVLVPEDNPEPVGENSEVAPSYTGAVFSPMSKERIDRTINNPIVSVFAKNVQYSLRYHDCYVEVEFNPDTMQIVNLKQLANVSIKGSGDVVGAGTIGLERQELYSTVIIKDLQW